MLEQLNATDVVDDGTLAILSFFVACSNKSSNSTGNVTGNSMTS